MEFLAIACLAAAFWGIGFFFVCCEVPRSRLAHFLLGWEYAFWREREGGPSRLVRVQTTPDGRAFFKPDSLWIYFVDEHQASITPFLMRKSDEVTHAE